MWCRLLAAVASVIVLAACGNLDTPPTPTSRPRSEQIAQLTQVAAAQEASAVARAATQTVQAQPTATVAPTTTLPPRPTSTLPPPTQIATGTARGVGASAPIPTATVMSRSRGLPRVDDFSSRMSGWPDEKTYYSTVVPELNYSRYLNGGYQIKLDIPQSRVSAIHRDLQTIGDVIIEVDVTIVAAGGTDRVTAVGVECRRHSSNGQSYLFNLLSYGGWGIYRTEPGQAYRLGGSGGVPDPAVLPSPGTNRLRAECVGNRFRISVNGVLLLDAIDPDPLLAPGAVALYGNRAGENPLDVRFDNFTAAAP